MKYNKKENFINQKEDARRFLSLTPTPGIVIIDDYRINFIWEKIIYFRHTKTVAIEDINNKRSELEKEIDKEIDAAEEEINNLKINSNEKIKNIAVETSSELIKQLIGEEVNNSSISAIVDEQSKKDKENQHAI